MKRSDDESPPRRLSDDPDYRARLEHLYNWLLDGHELKRLQKLVEQVRANPVKRRDRRYAVRNPDGTIYRRPKNRRRRPGSSAS
jgi:hypothetical protein